MGAHPYIGKQKKCKRYLFKLHSERLRRSRWKLEYPLEEALNTEDIISLSDSQILRFIDELNGDTSEAREEEASYIKKEIKRLKKSDSSKKDTLIANLYKRFYNLQFVPDYMCLIIDKMSDYDRANKGFSINGVKYHRFLGTNGGIKNSTIVYVSERLYPQLYERLCCGRNLEQKFVPAKLEAYQALICSGSIPVSMPKGIIVVPDCITHFKEDIIRVDDSQSDEPIVEFLKDQEIELTESDGYGIMLPSLSYRWARELDEEEDFLSGCNLRGLPWTKGMVFTMDYLAFGESIAKNFYIKDAWGDTDEKLSPVVDRVSALETAKDDLAGKVETNTTDISGLKTDVAGLKESNETISATTTETKNTVDILKQNVSGYDSQFESINSDITAINESIKDLGKNTGHEYDVSYEENVFTLYEDDVIKKQFTITGGSGPSDTTTVTIERITSSDAIFLAGNSAVIEYNFTSVDNTGDTTGNGTATWRVGSTTVATTVAAQGKNSFDITQYLKNGANSIRLSITDSFGTIATKTWTITIVDFKIESIFDDTLFYSDEVTFRYTPYGDINKTVHFVLDGKEIAGVETTASGRQMTYTLAKQSHGAHLLKVYMTASINNQDVTSESVYKDIIWVEQGNTTPIIGCSMVEFTAKQYNTTSIKYVVYDPEHNPATVKLSVDGKVASTLTVGRTAQIWSYKSTAIGKQSLTISCRRITKILTATIEKLDINVSPVTTNLAFDFNPSGKNNGEADWLKINDNLTIEVSDNFDTTNGGYQVDEDGDTYFCVKAGTAATIPYQLFADDAKKTGKNFKFIYKCTNVKNYEAQVLSCFADNLGYTVKAQEATLKSEQNEISVPYCEDYYMELEFNILPDSEYTEMVMWVDGIPTRVKLYATSDSFTQTNPVGITIGSDDCDVIVYRIKAYTMNLTDDEILDNFIADAKNANEIINRYNRNDILDSSGGLDPDVLAEKCPDLRIIKLEVPVFTTGKKNKVPFTSVQQIYKNGRPVDNWISRDGIHNGQGTSSEYYGDSGRNLEINCKNGFTFADDTTADVYSMDENAIGINYFNVKVNIASSENINNAGLQGEYQEFNPYIRPARKKDPRVRDTMQFYPCVVFLKETDVDNAVEFKDGQWHFYAAGDIGNSKKNTVAQGMDPENHKEFIVEVSNNTDPQCRFLSDDLSNEEWGGDTSFEMRYQNPNCTEEEIQAGRQAWNDLLTWVVNADSETFVKEFEQHFIKDSLLFYYLFTERHTMVDNRAKNTFWHTEDLVHWDLCMDYDNDTAMGNDNEGGLTLTYGYEDTDTIGTKSVFNASDSKVFCYIRDYMFDDLQSMFLQMEAKLTWSANRILNKFETLQNYKPERLWIADMRRKYFRPYEDKGTTSYLEMMNGSKKQQRRQFQKYQEKYIASKYVGSTTTSDVITIRGYTPTNWTGVKPDGTFHIVPYADSYVDVRFGSNLVRQRAKRGQTYTVKSPIAAIVPLSYLDVLKLTTEHMKTLQKALYIGLKYGTQILVKNNVWILLHGSTK